MRTWLHTPPRRENLDLGKGTRAFKQRLVVESRAHAALVMDGSEAVASCRYGSPAELPNVHHRKHYEAEPDSALGTHPLTPGPVVPSAAPVPGRVPRR